MGAKKQTIGFRYFFSIHMGIGRGPLNEIAEIRAGDVVARSASIKLSDGGKLVTIDKPELFGGEKKEGGIQGTMYCYNGAADQELQPALTSSLGTLPAIADQLGGDVPNFRGVVSLWFDGMICAMNPYPKEWSFRVRRSNAGWYNDDPWYPQKATITLMSESGGKIQAMNPSHMLYEINTNPEWGRGMPASMLDENSYVRAANQLCDEGLGLCIPWFRQENIKVFIPIIIDHVGGVQYVDRETGKMTFRLIRNDYVAADLPLFTPDTGLIDILEDDASGEDSAYNEIVVTGFDPTTKEDIQVRVQSLASIQSQEEIISNTIEYRGLSTRDLAGRVAQRELKAQIPLRRLTVILDRRGWRIAPGMPFRVSMPSKGIASMILRAGECTDGTMKDGSISIKAMQDIFGMPETSFITPPGSNWTPPSFTPLPSPEARLYEVNWRDFYRVTDASEQSAVDEGASYVGILAKRPAGQSQGYDVLTSLTSGSYSSQDNSTAGFTEWLTLNADIGPLDTSFIVAADNLANFMTDFEEGMAVLIGDEQMEMVSFNEGTLTATVKRAVADTIPQSHTLGETIWLIDDELGSNGDEYQDGETVYAKALTRTSTGVLDQSLATELSIVVDQKVFRPYPPGDVKVDGDSIYALPVVDYTEPEVTWAHRDRILQADMLVGHVEGSVGPETGVTYTIRVYESVSGTTLLSTHDAIATTSWVYDAALQTADGNPASVDIELESVRDTITSKFKYRFTLVLDSAAISEFLTIDYAPVTIDGEGISF